MSMTLPTVSSPASDQSIRARARIMSSRTGRNRPGRILSGGRPTPRVRTSTMHIGCEIAAPTRNYRVSTSSPQPSISSAT